MTGNLFLWIRGFVGLLALRGTGAFLCFCVQNGAWVIGRNAYSGLVNRESVNKNVISPVAELQRGCILVCLFALRDREGARSAQLLSAPTQRTAA